MLYEVKIAKKADSDIRRIIKSGDKASIKRIEHMLKELELHPATGIGNPEQLKYELLGYWSRRINKKDRLIYQIFDKEVIVVIVSAWGHYEDVE